MANEALGLEFWLMVCCTQTDVAEVLVVLIAFGVGWLCLAAVAVHRCVRQRRESDRYRLLKQKGKAALNQEISDMAEVERVQQYYARQRLQT